MTRWVVENLGPDTPMHFSAFHPDWKMRDVPPTPASTLRRARHIALGSGVRYAYTGNIDDSAGESTYCHGCGDVVIGRDRYDLKEWNLTAEGRCRTCGAALPGVAGGSAARRLGSVADDPISEARSRLADPGAPLVRAARVPRGVAVELAALEARLLLTRRPA